MDPHMDYALSRKIKHVSLLCSLLVCYAHSFTLTRPYAETSGEPYAFTHSFIQGSVIFGMAGITTPFFFCLSAFLLFNAILQRNDPSDRRIPSVESYRVEVKKRVRSLLIPYLAWCAWSFALLVTLQGVPAFRPYFNQPLIDQTLTVMLQRILWDPVAYPLWFVRDLFIMVICWPAFYLILRNRMIARLALVMAASAWFMWFDVRTTRAILFFAIGGFLAVHRPRFPSAPRAAAWTCLGLWFIVAAAISLYVMEHGRKHPLLNNLAIILGLWTVWTGYEHVKTRLKNGLIERLSGFTFFVYAAHEPIATFLRKSVAAVAGNNHLLLLTSWILSGALLFLGTAAVGIFIFSHAPRLYQFLAGGRAKRSSRAMGVPGLNKSLGTDFNPLTAPGGERSAPAAIAATGLHNR